MIQSRGKVDAFPFGDNVSDMDLGMDAERIFLESSTVSSDLVDVVAKMSSAAVSDFLPGFPAW